MTNLSEKDTSEAEEKIKSLKEAISELGFYVSETEEGEIKISQTEKE